jgi:hypothetical protein
MNKLTKYEPQHVISTIDGDTHYILSSHREAFKNECNQCKIVTVGDSDIAVHQIKSIKPVRKNVPLKSLDSDHRKRVEARIKEFKLDLNREPSDAEIQGIIEKLAD